MERQTIFPEYTDSRVIYNNNNNNNNRHNHNFHLRSARTFHSLQVSNLKLTGRYQLSGVPQPNVLYSEIGHTLRQGQKQKPALRWTSYTGTFTPRVCVISTSRKSAVSLFQCIRNTMETDKNTAREEVMTCQRISRCLCPLFCYRTILLLVQARRTVVTAQCPIGDFHMERRSGSATRSTFVVLYSLLLAIRLCLLQE